jgi:hypothetical protein
MLSATMLSVVILRVVVLNVAVLMHAGSHLATGVQYKLSN